jgi:hypothetical protein
MGYQDRDDVSSVDSSTATQWGSFALAAVVRVVGLVVLFVGLWVGVKVIMEAWALYEQPQRIVRFADDIQKHSNLDGIIGSLATADSEESASDGKRAPAKAPGNGLRLSYFAAWFIALLLIFVIGSLAMSAITTGGQLALYDLQLKRYSRAVIKEVRQLRD